MAAEIEGLLDQVLLDLLETIATLASAPTKMGQSLAFESIRTVGSLKEI
jgi:hypothetical protein